MPGQAITQGKSNRAANTGYVNYINSAAFVLPPIKDAPGNYLSPFGNASRNPGRTPPFNETDLDLNKRFNTPIENLQNRVPRRGLQRLQPHQPLSARYNQRLAGHNPRPRLSTGATPSLSQITGGDTTGGGQISSTFEPRILQFALKIIY